MIKIFGFLFLLLTIDSYSQNNVFISGSSKNNPKYKNVWLDELSTNLTVAKDTLLPDGTFKISALITSINLYKLRFSYEGAGLFIILKPTDHLTMVVDFNDMNNPIIEGSEDTKLLYSTIQALKTFDNKIEQMSKRINEEKNDFLTNTLKRNSQSLAVLFFTDKTIIDNNLKLMQQICSDLLKKYADNPFVIEFNKNVNDASFLAPGTLSPEIAMADTSGKTIKLSDFRGKYVLIDFWASWCGPCRKTNPYLKSLYVKYRNKNFEIYSVSLDKNKDSWIGAINADKLEWIHVSDLNYWENAAAVKYRISNIPYSVLIDPSGIILAKGLQPDQLDEKLKELLK